ncbi:MAG: hypothetical protein N2712_04155 [Brevinematales bacterium]|nr:hypothetical protein [Brevinematales bacterium]
MKNILSIFLSLLASLLIFSLTVAQDINTHIQETSKQENTTSEEEKELTNDYKVDYESLLSIRVKEIEEETLPNYFDYVVDEKMPQFDLQNGDKEYILEKSISNIERLANYNEIVKEILIEDEKQKREYYRLERPIVAVDIEQLDSRVFARGNVLFGLSYGSIRRTPDITTPVSSFIKENFNVNQDMRVLSTSKIGNKVSVDIEFDQKSAINRFNVSYKEPEKSPQTQPQLIQQQATNQTREESFVRELTFGEISFSKSSSKYVNYTAISRSAQGIKFVGKRDKFSIEAIGTLSTTVPTKRSFSGTKRVSERSIRDIDFIKRKFFKLPDNNVDVGSIVLLVSVSSLEPFDLYIDGIAFRKMIPGNEYIYDRFNNEIELKYSLDINKSLAIFYTHSSGQPITFSTNIYKGTGSDNKEYLYLFKPSIGYSPYEAKNLYSIGTIDINLSQGFDIYVYLTSDPNISTSLQFKPSDYYIDVTRGIIRFNNPQPFLSNANYNIYNLNRDPLDVESTYTFRIRYYENITTYQLDFDIVEGSEEVRINGVLIPKDKYTIFYPIGRIIFRDTTLINEGDRVEISYEYRPFFGGSQKISLGTIAEYQLSDFMNSKLSTAFWISQSGGTAPRLTSSTPETGIITSLVNRIDFKNLFNIQNKNLNTYLDFECAVSIVNPNSFGAVIIDDFEVNKKSFLLTKDEDSWILSSPSINDGCFYTNRGKLYYKDYRQYYANESFTLMSYTWNLPSSQILPYSQKPGPYIASGGRLSPGDFPNVSQFSLVFDYDFSDGNWVGAMLLLSSAGVDLSDISEIIVSYKLQMDNDFDNNYDDNNTNKITLLLQLGTFSEDIDGDNFLDTEISASQNGFDFNDPTNANTVITKIGSGRKGTGNGRIDTEDINKNGRLDKEENFVSFSNTVEGSGWKKLSININSLSPSQIEILKKTYLSRIILKKNAGLKGRVLVDEIQFKFRTTRNYKIDGILVRDPYQIKSTTISVYDSPLYLKNRFFNIEAKTPEEKERLQEYSYLHGTSAISVSEAKSIDETSLRITYFLSNVSIDTNSVPYEGGREGVVNISFNSSQNLSPYSKLVWYLFIPTVNEAGQQIKQSGDTLEDEVIVVRLISKERDYFEFNIPISRLRKDYWNRLELRIREDYKLILNNNIYDTVYPNVVGFPLFRDINALELGVRVSENSVEPINIGEIWFNEFFLTDVNWSISSAINSTLNLQYTGDVNIFGINIISMPYIVMSIENIFPNFKGTGGKENANILTYTHYHSSELFKILGLNHSFSIQRENSVKDPTLPEYLLYNNTSRAFRYSLNAKHNLSILPTLSYSFSDRQNTISQNGLINLGTNLFIQNTISEEVGLDSSISISYNLLLLNNTFSLRNTLDLSSSYNAKNVNTKTNDVFLFSSPSFQNWVYTLGLSSGINYLSFGINNNFKHSETFYTSENKPINFVEELSKVSIPQRNQYSLNLLFEGFRERGIRREVYESDTLSMSYANLMNFANVYITPSYEFKDFNFNYTSNMIRRDIQMNGRITYKVDINVNRLIFSILSLNSSHNTTFSANSIDYNLKWYDFYTNNLYRGVIAIPFYEYIGLFGYENLSNALVFVSNLYNLRSIVNQFSSAGISLSLIPQEDILLSLIPRNYSLDYSTTTVRELSSFRQLNRSSFSAVSYIPIHKINWFIFKRSTNISVNDVQTTLSVIREEDLNASILKTTASFSSSFSGILEQQNSFSISYTISYLYQDIITNLPNFYKDFGIGLVPPQTLFNSISHNVRLLLTFSYTSNEEFDIIFTKLKAKSVIENKEELNFSLENPWYNNNKFTSFRRKVFELNFFHETSINLSDFVRFSGYLKFLLSQLSEVFVQNDLVNEKFLDYIPGIEVGINIRVVF